MNADFFSKRLIYLRTQRGISARDMSLSLGQSESYINKIENQKSLPSMISFFNICEYLDIDPKDFFNSEKDNPTLLKELMKELSKLTDEQLVHLLAFLKDFPKKSCGPHP